MKVTPVAIIINFTPRTIRFRFNQPEIMRSPAVFMILEKFLPGPVALSVAYQIGKLTSIQWSRVRTTVQPHNFVEIRYEINFISRFSLSLIQVL